MLSVVDVYCCSLFLSFVVVVFVGWCCLLVGVVCCLCVLSVGVS